MVEVSSKPLDLLVRTTIAYSSLESALLFNVSSFIPLVFYFENTLGGPFLLFVGLDYAKA